MTKSTIKDVAKKAGVGVGTVSRVINNSPSVSVRTRKKVQSVIEELNFQPNLNARRLSLGKTYTIAVLAPFFTRPAFVERLRGLESVFANSEYDFVIYNVDSAQSRDKYFNQLARRQRVDGLLVMSLIPTEEHAQQFKESGIPTVLVDADCEQFSRILINDWQGAYEATQYLLELGHRRIGYISDHLIKTPFNYLSVFDRFDGFKSALADYDAPFCSEMVIESDVTRKSSRDKALALLQQEKRPSAIFAYSDTHAFGVLKAAEMLNISVPDELSIIGYDDIELSEYLHLTTMRQSLFDAGAKGAELLLQEVLHPDQPQKKIKLTSELVVRGTTAPPSFLFKD